MRLRFPLLLPFAMGTCLVTSLWAQEREVKKPQPAAPGVINDLDVTVTDLTEEKLNNPPKREIKFERLEETLKRKLTKPDPKLFEQKYAATFRLDIPMNGQRYADFVQQAGDDVAQLAFLGKSYLIYPQFNNGMELPSESFARMIMMVPKDNAITKEESELFTNLESHSQIIRFSPEYKNRPESWKWNMSILGTTAAAVESRSTALLTILDQGACRPIQLAIFKKREPLCVQLRDQRKALEESRRMVNALQEELKAYVDFTPDMLSNLRVQQLQLDVELAGVKARIATCERFLAQPALKADRRNQIEDLKVAAEIEFSGFEARRSKSSEFIAKVKTAIDLTSKSSTADFSRKVALGETRQIEEQIKNVDAAIRAYAPLPLVDNKVVVQPLEWTQ